MSKCTACGEEMRLIKAGVSKKTGKPYNAFYSCKCGNTQNLPAQNSPDQRPVPAASPAPKTNSNVFLNEILTRIKDIQRNVDGLVGALINQENQEAFEIHKSATEPARKKFEIPVVENDQEFDPADLPF
jgi:hypothetical protein